MSRIVACWVFTMLTMPLVDPFGMAVFLAVTYFVTMSAVTVEGLKRHPALRTASVSAARTGTTTWRAGSLRDQRMRTAA